MNSEKNYTKHLESEHKISPFSTYLREIVYGATDGIVTTFAVVAGFNGAQNTSALSQIPILAVLLFGTANLFADGVSMALGNFLSIRSNQDVYTSERNKELDEVRKNPEMEKKETMYLLVQKGFTQIQAQKITELYAQNEDYWVDFMMNKELEMSDPQNDNPFFTALATFISFIVFGIIPLLPYILQLELSRMFLYSIIATVCALVLLGILRYRVTKENIVRSIGEIVILGGTSSIVAFFVGTLFK